jgi:hypothetical protein
VVSPDRIRNGDDVKSRRQEMIAISNHLLGSINNCRGTVLSLILIRNDRAIEQRLRAMKPA